MTESIISPRERLEFIARSLAVASIGEMPAWGALLALERSLPLIVDPEMRWRDENRELIADISRDVYRVALVLVDAVGARITNATIFVGLMSMALVIENPNTSYIADRVSHMKILANRLAILIEEDAIAERGNLLAHEVSQRAALIGAPSPSAASH